MTADALTDAELDAIQARVDVASPGPWEVGEVWLMAGVLAEKFGDGRCAYCNHGEPVWVGMDDINGKRMIAHRHRMLEPYGAEFRISNAAGQTVVGPTDVDEGGVCDPDDLAFIVAARVDVPRLLAEVRRLRGLVDGKCPE